MSSDEKKVMLPPLKWQIDLSRFLQQRVKLVTKEGFIRNSVLVDFRYASTFLDGHEVEYVVEVELQGNDVIPFPQVVSIDLQ